MNYTMKTISRGKFNFKIEQGEASNESYIETQKVVHEIFKENVYQINPYDFSDSMVFIDIGANIGITSVFVASFNDDEQRVKDWGRIKVHAFEPVPANVRLLQENVEINGYYQDILIHPVAITKSGRDDVFMSEELGGSMAFHSKKDGLTKVPAISINRAIKETRFADVMKIDVEGSEYEIIEDATIDTLKRVKKIVIEFHGTKDEIFGKMIAKLASVYNLHIIGSPERGGYIYGERN